MVLADARHEGPTPGCEQLCLSVGQTVKPPAGESCLGPTAHSMEGQATHATAV